jgi:hypothetical protein
VGKHCNNPQCFKKKTTKQNSQPAQYEKIKSTKTILEKQIHKKNKKTM